MISQPRLIAGTNHVDTEQIERAHGQIICKSGSEGIQCLSKKRDGIGIAIKVEDGSKIGPNVRFCQQAHHPGRPTASTPRRCWPSRGAGPTARRTAAAAPTRATPATWTAW